MELLIINIVFFLGFFLYNILDFKKGKKIYYWFLVTLLIIFSGFRYRLGIDTVQYSEFYEQFDMNKALIDSFSFKMKNYSYESFYLLLNIIFKVCSIEFVYLQLFISISINSIIGIIFKDKRYNFFLLMIYYLDFYYILNFELLRQSLSICFFGYIFFIKEYKGIKLYLGILGSCLFHKASIIYLLIISFCKKINPKKIILLPLFVLILDLKKIIEIGYRILPSNFVLTKLYFYTLNSYYFSKNLSILQYIRLILLVIVSIYILSYCIKKNKKYLMLNFSIFYVLFLILGFKYPVLSRMKYQFFLFYLLTLNNFFCLVSKKNKLVKFFLLVYILCINYISYREWTSYNIELNEKNYVKIIPYNNYLYKKNKNIIREKYYKKIWKDLLK